MTATAEADGPGQAPGPPSSMARDSLVNLIGFGVYGVTNFLLVVVITRRLGSDGAGTLLTAIAVFSIVARSAMAGTDLGLIRFVSRFLARGRTGEIRYLYRVALVPVTVLSTLAGVAVFSLAEPLADLLTAGPDHRDLAAYLRVLAPFIPIATVYQSLEAGTRGFGTMVPSALVERIGRSSSLPLLVLAAISAGGGATLVGLAWAGPFAVALVAIALWTNRLMQRAESRLLLSFGVAKAGSGSLIERRPASAAPTPSVTPSVAELVDDLVADDPSAMAAPARSAVASDESQGLGPDRESDPLPADPLPADILMRRFWAFVLPRSFAGMFALATTWIDSLLLSGMEGSEAVGVYNAAIRWLIVGNVAGNAVTMAFGPQIARVMAVEGAEGGGKLFQDATALLVLLAWPAYLMSMVFGPFLLTAFGDDFGDGAMVIAITGAGFLIASAAGPVDMLLVMAGRSRLSLINAAIALATNVIANIILIPIHGIRGAALAWAISLVVANAVPLVQMHMALGVHPYGRRTIHTLALTSAVGVALVLVRLALGATFAGFAVGVAVTLAILGAGVFASPDRLGIDQVLRRGAA